MTISKIASSRFPRAFAARSLDPATLDLLQDLLVQPDARNLLLIAAYRDNEVDVNHPLMRKLAVILD